MSGEGGEADIDFAAGVEARELYLREKPERHAAFWGDFSRRSFSEVRRQNLPDELREGVEYRDASLRWEARGWVEEAESGFVEERFVERRRKEE